MPATRPPNIHDVLSRLEGVRKQGGGWKADCPVSGHETPRGHLTVTDVGDKALVRCHSRGHSYQEICAAIGFHTLAYDDDGGELRPDAGRVSDNDAMGLLKAAYGLDDATIGHFRIEPDNDKQAWSYPVEGGTRYKNYDRRSSQKYWHTKGTPNQLYGYDDIPQDAEEVVLANGEPAVWVLRQAGIPAVCGIFGEGRLPDNSADILRARGVRILNVIPDLDSAGRDAAAKVLKALNGDLNLRIMELSPYLGDKSDVCDLYLWHGADNDAFSKSIRELPEARPQATRHDTQTGDAAGLVCMADVVAETVSWLWQPYIPLGKLTLLEGDPGIGKSWVSLALATAVSLGRGLPETEVTNPATVILASAEDGLGDTIRPRLDAMGASVSRIHAIKGALDFSQGGLAVLEECIEQVRPALVIVDPLVAYIGAGVDLHRANETRAVMAKLADMAERHDCTILAVRHLTKASTLKAIYRGLGSIDLAAACRSVLMAGCDPDDPQKRAIVHIKSNLAPMGGAIGYELREGGFYWTGESDLTWQRILSAEDSGEGPSARDEAADFLRDELAAGPVEAAQVWRDSKDAGIAPATLKRAKAAIGVVTQRRNEPGTSRGTGKWTWELPSEDASTVQEYQGSLHRDGDTLEDSRHENGPLSEGSDTLEADGDIPTWQQRYTDALFMALADVTELWTVHNRPGIPVSPGVTIRDLAKRLQTSTVTDEELAAVRRWLDTVRETAD